MTMNHQNTVCLAGEIQAMIDAGITQPNELPDCTNRSMS